MVTKRSRVKVKRVAVVKGAALREAALIRQVADLSEENRQLKLTVADQRHEFHMLEVELAEEDARAEAFEFVIRLQYGADVVKP